jgi:protein subunit release factor A
MDGSDELGQARPIPEPPSNDDALLAECDVETFRAGGPGGQHQNKTESAVRLTHRPTGVVVTSRRHRSQYMNREAALAALRRRLADLAKPEKPRVATRPTRASRKRRVESKRRLSQRKAGRRWRPEDEG